MTSSSVYAYGYESFSTSTTSSSVAYGYESSYAPGYGRYESSSAPAYGNYEASSVDYPEYLATTPAACTSKASPYGDTYLTTTYTTTYVDVYSTDYTTISTTKAVTYAKPTSSVATTAGECPPGFTTTEKYCSTGCGSYPTTVTLTVPITETLTVPYSDTTPEVAYEMPPTHETGVAFPSKSAPGYEHYEHISESYPIYATLAPPSLAEEDTTTIIYATNVDTVSVVPVPASEESYSSVPAAPEAESLSPAAAEYTPGAHYTAEQPSPVWTSGAHYTTANVTFVYGTGTILIAMPFMSLDVLFVVVDTILFSLIEICFTCVVTTLL